MLGWKRTLSNFLAEALLAGLFLLSTASAGPAGPAQQPPLLELDDLLDRAAAYCDRLSRTALDFVSRERVDEWLYPRAGIVPSFTRRQVLSVGPRENRTFLSEYQLVRDRSGSIRETRTTLKNGRRIPSAQGNPSGTHIFTYSGIVMGPLGLLSSEAQRERVYRIVREEKVGKDKAVVIEVLPKPGVRLTDLIGRIWLRGGDAAVLKIEWEPTSIENYAEVEKTAARLQMAPLIVVTSEFAFEKNGIRFPSRFTIKESYKRGGRRFQRSEIDVVYDRYKFFTVETHVTFDR